jgi:hypothetical protein
MNDAVIRKSRAGLALWTVGVLALFISTTFVRSQGVPAWAPRALDGGQPDGASAGAVPKVEQYARPDAGAGSNNVFSQVLEFVLGFNPLEPSFDELARRRDAGATAATADAGLDAGSGSAVPQSQADAGAAVPSTAQ